MKYKKWKINQYKNADFQAMTGSGVSPLAAAVLCARGLDSTDKARAFLVGGGLHDPKKLPDMDKAAACVQRAIEDGKRIAVYGDYDVDGITSTCLMLDYLTGRGASCVWYIPGRLEEGYGLNEQAIRKLKGQGVELIITVDCGITAVEEAELIGSLGMELVITDHHECRQELPSAAAVVNPNRRDSEYPFPHLAGVGVAFKLICALEGEGSDTGLMERYGDLLVLGTIADVMPLLDENRYIVKSGLKALEHTNRVGLRMLMREAGVEKKPVTASVVGYSLAPRINAAGRMERVELAVELILTRDYKTALDLAAELCALNRKRQQVESDILSGAARMLESEPQPGAIVLADGSWHQGVVGIVASRLAEQYGCPAVLICLEDGIGKASSRSYGGFNLYAALEESEELLDSFGGHELAAGFVIREENIDEFRRRISKAAGRYYRSGPDESALELDCAMDDPRLLTIDNVEDLRLLEPCGAGNRRPTLAIIGARVETVTPIGGGRHIKLRLVKGGVPMEGVYFGMAAEQAGIAEGDMADVAFIPQINEFRGRRTVQLLIQDIRPDEKILQLENREKELYGLYLSGGDLTPEQAELLIPQRREFVAVWRYLRSRGERLIEDWGCLSRKVTRASGIMCTVLKTRVCLDVLSEFSLIDFQADGDTLHIAIRATGKKADLTGSAILARLKRIGKEDTADGVCENPV